MENTQNNKIFEMINNLEPESVSHNNKFSILEKTTESIPLPKEQDIVALFNNLEHYNFGQIKSFDLAQIETEVLNESIYLDVFAGSDLRLKKDVEPLKNSLDKILSLDGITYLWNEKTASANAPTSQQPVHARAHGLHKAAAGSDRGFVAVVGRTGRQRIHGSRSHRKRRIGRSGGRAESLQPFQKTAAEGRGHTGCLSQESTR
jgi:hypothetical protein